MHLSKSARPQISSKEDKAKAYSGVLWWRVFSLLASHAYCISSICSKAVFIVSREDTASGSQAVPSRWRSGHFLPQRRCVSSRSDLVHLHGLSVHQQALRSESYLDTARRCCRSRVIAVSVRNQFDRPWGRQCLSWVERHTVTGRSVSLTLWTFSLAAAMRSFAFWSLQWALKCHDRLFAT